MRSSASLRQSRAARALAFSFTLTARAENHIRDNPDLEDTIARLQAFEQAGADVLYAPGLADRRRHPRAVRGAVSKLVNILGGAAEPERARDQSKRGDSASAWEEALPGPRPAPWLAAAAEIRDTGHPSRSPRVPLGEWPKLSRHCSESRLERKRGPL